MFRRYLYYLRKSDWAVTAMALFLATFGLMSIYSIEAAAENSNFLNFKKQLIFFGVGFLLMVFFTFFDYRSLKAYSPILYIFSGAVLLAVVIIGTTIHGTRGWLVFFGSQGFQPVELVKIVLVLVIARLYTDYRAELSTIRRFGTVVGVAVLVIALVLVQPDLGSAVILLAIFLGMLFLVKTKKIFLISLLVLLCASAIFGWFFVLKPYQQDRLLTFVNPTRDPWKSGYNIKQSIIAVGSGNFFGRGLSLGSQSRLNFLPSQETDFIFAVIAEELGFVGAILVLGFFTLLLFRLALTAQRARDDFGRFVLSGVIIYIAAQTILNIGMNIGLLPIAGVPLPLVSYGGSSLIATFIALGIAQSIRVRQIGTAT